jgi:hypothetical protein
MQKNLSSLCERFEAHPGKSHLWKLSHNAELPASDNLPGVTPDGESVTSHTSVHHEALIMQAHDNKK